MGALLVVSCLIFTFYFSLEIAVRALRACYSFATAQKSSQKRPPNSFAPRKALGVPELLTVAYEHALTRCPCAQG